jgi:hypothetical protein
VNYRDFIALGDDWPSPYEPYENSLRGEITKQQNPQRIINPLIMIMRRIRSNRNRRK